MKLKKGFTLIELLVVIAIIGILAAMVLVALNSARSKAKDARIQSSVNQFRVQVEADYNGTTYVDAVNSGGAAGAGAYTGNYATARNDARAQGPSGAGAWVQSEAATTYMFAAQLNNGGTNNYFCVDSAGAAKQTGATAPTTAMTACP